MVTATYNNKTVQVDRLVNRGEWFGQTWLIEVGVGFSSFYYVVEAHGETDAIDTLADSKYSKCIDCDPCDECKAENYDDCTCTFAGNDSHPVDLENVYIHRCKVNYFAKPE